MLNVSIKIKVLSVMMQNVIMLSVVMMSVAAPLGNHISKKKHYTGLYIIKLFTLVM
jgi:hypothetical protein